jgi:hypothetical protein
MTALRNDGGKPDRAGNKIEKHSRQRRAHRRSNLCFGHVRCCRPVGSRHVCRLWVNIEIPSAGCGARQIAGRRVKTVSEQYSVRTTFERSRTGKTKFYQVLRLLFTYLPLGAAAKHSNVAAISTNVLAPPHKCDSAIHHGISASGIFLSSS